MPAHRPKDNSYDAYEYTAHSHTYNSFDIPSAKVSKSCGLNLRRYISTTSTYSSCTSYVEPRLQQTQRSDMLPRFQGACRIRTLDGRCHLA